MKRKFKPFKTSASNTEAAGVINEPSKSSMHAVFNEFIKGPTFLLAYLYLISICYHLGYWNGFRVDVFNFYDIQDLAKGATHGMTDAVLFLGIFIIPITISGFLLNGNLRGALLDWVANNMKIYFFSIVLFISIATLASYYNRKQSTPFRELTSHIIPNYDKTLLPTFFMAIAIVLLYSCAVTALANKQFSGETRLKDRLLNTLMYSFAFILPAISFLSAMNSSILVRRGVRFEYLISNKISGDSAVYKYLGKAGSYYFLSTVDGNKIITIKSDSIQPLAVSYFSLYDSLSGRLFLKEYSLLPKEDKKILPNKKKLKRTVADSTKTKK